MKVLVLGGVIIDCRIVTDYFRRGEDTLIRQQSDRPAGCALNTAVTLSTLGCRPSLVSVLGNDSRAQQIEAYLKRYNLWNNCILPAEGTTGYCLTLLEPDGERSFMTFRGCEEYFPEELCARVLQKEFPYAYLSGYFLLNEDFFTAKMGLLETLKSRGCRIVFDPGALIEQLSPSMLERVLNACSIAVPNRSEAEMITRILNLKIPFSRCCLSRGYELVVIKNGAAPAEVYAPGREKMSMKPYPVKAVDTTGAGDSFAAGLIYALQSGLPLEECVKTALACGSLAAAAGEPHGGFGLEDLRKIMNEGDWVYD